MRYPLFLYFNITLFANTTMASRRTWKTVWLRCEPEYTGGTQPYQVRCTGIYRHQFRPLQNCTVERQVVGKGGSAGHFYWTQVHLQHVFPFSTTQDDRMTG